MTSDRKNCKIRLAEAFREAGAPWEYIEMALRGRYDDIESDSPTPITDLVRVCLRLNLRNLVARAKAGEFDAKKWEWDAARDGTRG